MSNNCQGICNGFPVVSRMPVWKSSPGRIKYGINAYCHVCGYVIEQKYIGEICLCCKSPIRTHSRNHRNSLNKPMKAESRPKPKYEEYMKTQ